MTMLEACLSTFSAMMATKKFPKSKHGIPGSLSALITFLHILSIYLTPHPNPHLLTQQAIGRKYSTFVYFADYFHQHPTSTHLHTWLDWLGRQLQNLHYTFNALVRLEGDNSGLNSAEGILRFWRLSHHFAGDTKHSHVLDLLYYLNKALIDHHTYVRGDKRTEARLGLFGLSYRVCRSNHYLFVVVLDYYRRRQEGLRHVYKIENVSIMSRQWHDISRNRLIHV